MRTTAAMVCLVLSCATAAVPQAGDWIPNAGGPYGGTITDILPLPDRNLATGLGTVYRAAPDPGMWTALRVGIPANQLLDQPRQDGTGALYAAIDGLGVLRSATGASWGFSNGGLLNLSVKALSSRDSLLLAGTGSGLFSYAEGGAQWNQFAFAGDLVLKVGYKPGGPTFAALPVSGMQRYSSGSWSPVNNGLSSFIWTALSVSAASSHVAVSTDQQVSYSLNLGDSWSPVLSGTGFSALKFNAGGDLYVAAGGIVKRTTNQGSSFSDLPDLGPGRINNLSFDASNRLWAAHSIRGILLYDGNGWQERNQGISSFSVQAIGGDDASLIATSRGGYIRRNHGGVISYDRFIPGSTTFELNVLSAYKAPPPPPAQVRAHGVAYDYFGTQAGLFRSSDDGATWEPANAGFVSRIIWDIVVKDSAAMFVATYDGIYRSTNQGSSWVQANSGNTPLTSGLTLQRSTGHLFALAAGVSRSTDNGANWNTVYITPGFTSATGMDFAPDGTWYVGVFNNGVARSTNNGATWDMLTSGLDDRAVRDVRVNDQGVVFAATSSGVYRSTNGGAAWSLFDSGFDASFVTALFLDSRGFLHAGTMGGGVYRTALSTGAAESPSGLPAGYDLGQNYPNPFNPVATIEYDLPAESRATLRVFDLLGRLVATLVDRTEPAGRRSVRFDGAGVSSGVYVYRLDAVASGARGRSYSRTRTMVLMK